MAISRQYGIPAIQELARQAGQAQAAREKEAREFQANQAALDKQFRKDMQMMDYQFELEAQMRSKAFELEKMETRSRIDFEYDEKRRINHKQNLDGKLEALRKALDNSQLSKEEYDSEVRNTKMEAAIAAEEAGLTGLAESLYAQVLPPPTELERMSEFARRQKPVVEQPEAKVTPTTEVPSRVESEKGTPVPFSQAVPANIVQNNSGEFAIYDPKTNKRGWATPAELPLLESEGIQVVEKQPTKKSDWWGAFFPQLPKPSISGMTAPELSKFPGWYSTEPLFSKTRTTPEKKAVRETKKYSEQFSPQGSW